MKNEKTISDKMVADKTMADNRTAAGTKSDNGQLSKVIAAEWKEGDVILDTYEVLDLLGEGGMAKVFKVHHKGCKKYSEYPACICRIRRRRKPVRLDGRRQVI